MGWGAPTFSTGTELPRAGGGGHELWIPVLDGREVAARHVQNTFFGVKGHNLLMNLDMEGIAISYGSACSSGSANAPQALIETGMSENEARCSVRISIGKMIVKNDINRLFISLENIINRIQKK